MTTSVIQIRGLNVTYQNNGSAVRNVDVDIPARHDVVVYNILGASPVMWWEVIYVSDSNPRYEPGEPDFKFHCGESFVIYRSVDYVFTKPDERIDFKKNSPTESRYAVGINQDGGWVVSATRLQHEGRFEQAAGVMKGVALADPNSGPHAGAAAVVLLRWADKTDEALELTCQVLGFPGD